MFFEWVRKHFHSDSEKTQLIAEAIRNYLCLWTILHISLPYRQKQWMWKSVNKLGCFYGVGNSCGWKYLDWIHWNQTWFKVWLSPEQHTTNCCVFKNPLCCWPFAQKSSFPISHPATWSKLRHSIFTQTEATSGSSLGADSATERTQWSGCFVLTSSVRSTTEPSADTGAEVLYFPFFIHNDPTPTLSHVSGLDCQVSRYKYTLRVMVRCSFLSAIDLLTFELCCHMIHLLSGF